MITTLTGKRGTTFHAVNRDSSAALCRADLKPRIRADRGSSTGWTVALFRLPGDPAQRDTDRDVKRTTCTACLRKLATLTSEAFDAAAVHEAARSAELDNHVDHRVHDLAEAFEAAAAEQAARFAGGGVARILVKDEGGCLAVSVDSGFGLRLAATVPTGSRAAYPEAVKRGMDEACGKMAGIVAEYRRMYPEALVIGWSALR